MRHWKRRTAAFLVITVLTVPALNAQRRTTAAPAAVPGWDAFAQAFQSHVTGNSTAGASAVLVRDGQVIRHIEYGLADVDSGQKVNERTIYHWASNTKTLTAIAIMQLRDRGKLSLDDKVTKWVPELRMVHNQYGSMDDITIRMLLAHISGFQNPTWPYTDGASWEPFEPTSWEQLVAMMPYQQILFTPGSQYGYSNPGFIYLARIIEAITGDQYQTYIQKNIWTPLGMLHSYFGTTPYLFAADRSNSYVLERDSLGHDSTVAYGRDFNPGITIPNGGWNAPLGDLVLYVSFLTGATRGDTALARRYDAVLKRSSLEEMWVPTKLNDGKDGPVGLSFFVSNKGSTKIIGHTGEQAGFTSFVMNNPVTKESIIVVYNTINTRRGTVSGEEWTAVLDAGLALIVN
jgi:CubicO group peptidase (beta-lactamase class C family)